MKRENRVLIIDCQLLQTKAWHRGMGKYTVRLLESWLSNEEYTKRYSEVRLLLNELLPYEKDLKDAMDLLPVASPLMLGLEVPNYEFVPSITQAQRSNTETLDAYIAEQYAQTEVDFLITSLFLDEACPTFPTNAHKALIYYDLIPLMYYRIYLGLGVSEQYFTRFSVLFDADVIYAISETVANDLTAFLGINKSKIKNINGASNTFSVDSPTEPATGITKPFILMPTGGDPRKNNLMGVRGFGIFNELQHGKYQLVITSIFTEEQKVALHAEADNVVFTGNVSDSELVWLYDNAETVLFPTEYEGLGMPVLEAIDAGKTVVCSDIAVFREISSTAFFTFSPYQPDEIARALGEALYSDKQAIARKKRQYPAIQKRFTWQLAAQAVHDGFGSIKTDDGQKKLRIALVGPHISQPTQDAYFLSQQYGQLCDQYEVDLFYDMGGIIDPIRPSFMTFVTSTYDICELTSETYKCYDLVVYVISDENRSVLTLLASLAMPGLVVVACDDIGDVYKVALADGFMSRKRFKQAESDFNADVSSVSKGVLMANASPHGAVLKTQANELAYPLPRQRGLDNVVFIRVDGFGRRDEWNVDFVRDVKCNIDESKAKFLLVSQNTMPNIAKELLSLSGVELYEDASDHEYISLLIQSDLYVDASPGNSVEKMYPALFAHEYGLDVLLNHGAVVGENIPQDTIRISKDGSDVRDRLYSWLMSSSPKSASALKVAHQPVYTLPAAIEQTVKGGRL